MDIPLRNRNKEIVDYCIVSPEDFELLNQYKLYKNNDGYVEGYINIKWIIHRYIMIEILGYKIDSQTKVATLKYYGEYGNLNFN